MFYFIFKQRFLNSFCGIYYLLLTPLYTLDGIFSCHPVNPRLLPRVIIDILIARLNSDPSFADKILTVVTECTKYAEVNHKSLWCKEGFTFEFKYDKAIKRSMLISGNSSISMVFFNNFLFLPSHRVYRFC